MKVSISAVIRHITDNLKLNFEKNKVVIVTCRAELLKCSLLRLQRQLEELSSLVKDCGLGGEDAPPQPGPGKQRTLSTAAVLSSSLASPDPDTAPGPAPDPGHTPATPEGEQLAGVAQGDTKLRAKEEGRQNLSPIKVSTKYR